MTSAMKLITRRNYHLISTFFPRPGGPDVVCLQFKNYDSKICERIGKKFGVNCRFGIQWSSLNSGR